MTCTVYTLQEAASILRVPYRTLRDAVFQGRWPHIVVSPRKRLMTAHDINETLELLRKGASSPVEAIDVKMQKKQVRAFLEAA